MSINLDVFKSMIVRQINELKYLQSKIDILEQNMGGYR